MQPKVVVPGHGNPADLAKAKRDTGDDLDWLAREVEGALGNWEPIDEAGEWRAIQVMVLSLSRINSTAVQFSIYTKDQI